MDAIKIDGLIKRFGDFISVDNININIKEGEIYGLLGPNGAGKSTTIGIMCGLLKPTNGKIEILGVDVTKSMKNQNKLIGLVPQEIALYGELTAYENLKFFGQLYNLKGRELEESIDRVLDFIGLQDVKKKVANTFSGGMKRRLNIGCALIHSPKIVIMDEPTVGIDPQSRNHILQSVKKLNESGVTVIYTTHYMEEVEFICNKIAIIDKGKVIAEGTKEELKNIVSDTNKLVISVNYIDKLNLNNLKSIKGVRSVEIVDGKLEITSSKEINNLNEILMELSKEDIEILGIEKKEINLETIFLALTGRKLRD
ncbi:daunorubicin resistance ABC transporter, ATP-binding protein [Clostridium thermobutyricum]|uniref:Daunorubicin resistance ABC transporter, ATP-binding protein n=1 Tax=Clostridium thermobutyricum TaxID=29372 RepID=N9WDY6_9CLOT|nr:ABC transporter ATP-binding protein [Clostridium thermobutyricum]ENZ01241.1 daunorubicin resistance ABC transporter, ATP-binding protein [Clostridium thermobutyricum]